MIKILITGGNGFIAKSITESLKNSYSIISCNRNDLDLLDDYAVLKFIKNHSFDTIIHCATYDAAPEFTTKDPKLVLNNNLRMYFNLARCNSYFNKMLYFGSGAEFSRQHWIPKMQEQYFNMNVPSDPYGYSKYIMNQHAQSSHNIYNLRLFGLFGKYDDWRYRFISNACCKALLDMPINMRQNARFDYMYIDDLIKIVNWFITNKPKHHDYNVCTGEVYDYISIAKSIIKISNKNLDINIEREGIRDEYSGNNNRLMQECPVNFTHMYTSIQKLYEWYNSNIDTINSGEFVY